MSEALALVFLAACSRMCLTCRFMGSINGEVDGVGYWGQAPVALSLIGG